MRLLVLWIAAFPLLAPLTAFARPWTDNTGTHEVEAELLAFDGTQAVLRKQSGVIITVPLEKLSEADRQFLIEDAKKKEAAAAAPPPAAAPAMPPAPAPNTPAPTWQTPANLAPVTGSAQQIAASTESIARRAVLIAALGPGGLAVPRLDRSDRNRCRGRGGNQFHRQHFVAAQRRLRVDHRRVACRPCFCLPAQPPVRARHDSGRSARCGRFALCAGKHLGDCAARRPGRRRGLGGGPGKDALGIQCHWWKNRSRHSGPRPQGRGRKPTKRRFTADSAPPPAAEFAAEEPAEINAAGATTVGDTFALPAVDRGHDEWQSPADSVASEFEEPQIGAEESADLDFGDSHEPPPESATPWDASPAAASGFNEPPRISPEEPAELDFVDSLEHEASPQSPAPWDEAPAKFAAGEVVEADEIEASDDLPLIDESEEEWHGASQTTLSEIAEPPLRHEEPADLDFGESFGHEEPPKSPPALAAADDAFDMVFEEPASNAASDSAEREVLPFEMSDSGADLGDTTVSDDFLLDPADAKEAKPAEEVGSRRGRVQLVGVKLLCRRRKCGDDDRRG